MLVLVLYLCVSVLVLASKDGNYSHGGARLRFEQKFDRTCKKYSFVDQYIENLRHPRDEYLIFVFHERGHSGGGLGDRLAGMLTGLAYALRTNRTFLVVGDEAFENAFKPYERASNASKYSWRSWDWAGWQREFSANMSTLHCVNPRPSQTFCALDDPERWSKFKVIKYYGNRAYFCRWKIKKELGLGAELANTLGIHDGTDLYELAGCLLRLAIWPTELLWQALDDSLMSQFSQRHSTVTKAQVGFHFRCGDSSFTAPAGQKNPQCYFNDSVPWKGTNFYDDNSLDSPIDEAKCGHDVLHNISNLMSASISSDVNAAESPGGGDGSKSLSSSAMQLSVSDSVIAYIASDNGESALQIRDNVDWPFTIKPPPGCHVDMSHDPKCTLTTSLHWFMLSLSDYIVMQAIIDPENAVDSMDTQKAMDLVGKYKQLAPISAFSRYAAVYSLSPGGIRYGRGCIAVNTTALALRSHGNWVCDPRRFY